MSDGSTHQVAIRVDRRAEVEDPATRRHGSRAADTSAGDGSQYPRSTLEGATAGAGGGSRNLVEGHRKASSHGHDGRGERHIARRSAGREDEGVPSAENVSTNIIDNRAGLSATVTASVHDHHSPCDYRQNHPKLGEVRRDSVHSRGNGKLRRDAGGRVQRVGMRGDGMSCGWPQRRGEVGPPTGDGQQDYVGGRRQRPRAPP